MLRLLARRGSLAHAVRLEESLNAVDGARTPLREHLAPPEARLHHLLLARLLPGRPRVLRLRGLRRGGYFAGRRQR